jgi:G2/mitotic-specific cyclin 3/4
MPGMMVDLIARSDGRLINSEGRHAAATALDDTIQAYAPQLSTDQGHCPIPQTKLWSRFLTAVGLMRAAVASYVGLETARATQRTEGQKEGPRSPDQQFFGGDARRKTRVDTGTWQLQENEVQVGIVSRLQDEERVTAQREDDSSLPCRVASTLSKQNNVSNQNSRPDNVKPPMWSNGDDDARCIAQTTQASSSLNEKHGSSVIPTTGAWEIPSSGVGQMFFTEYEHDILRYHQQLEAKMLPHPQYMKHQGGLNWTMRAMLVDWIVQMHQSFELRPETLFLSVNYIDRFLSCRAVSSDRLQLLGAAAVLIAVKYEEGEPIPLSTIDLITSKRYGIEMIQRAERMILTTLQFELGWPGPMAFLRRTLVIEGDDDRIGALAQYFLEVSLMDQRFIADLPSRTAAVSHLLARKMLGKGAWVSTHVSTSQVLTISERLPCPVSRVPRLRATIPSSTPSRKLQAAAGASCGSLSQVLETAIQTRLNFCPASDPWGF